MVLTPDDPTKAQVWVRNAGTPEIEFDFYFPRGSKGEPGGIVVTSLPAATNLDQVTAAGLYSCTTGMTAPESALANLPMHEAGSLLVTTSGANSVQIQTYTTNTKAIYVRRRFSGAWSAWRSYAHTRTSEAAGRAMYAWDELNQREQLIYGDTGWRDISSSLIGGASGTAFIRRFGGVLEVSLSLTLADGTPNGTKVLSLPAGFISSYFKGYFPARAAGDATKTVFFRWTNNELYMGLPAAYSSSWGVLEISSVFTSTANWPTVLPGVAASSIPNL